MSSIHASGRRRRPGGRAIAATAFALGVAAASGYLVAGTGAQASNAAPAITANPPEPAEPPEPPPPPPTRPPLPTVPQATLVLDPGPGEAPSTTASPTTTTATDTTEANTTTSTVATATEGGDAIASAAPSQYSVTVTRAEVGCDGTIRVEYNTVAIPEPPLAASHVVVFNPVANAADFHVVETVGNPANGSFTFEQPGQIPGSYRLFVVAAFDPANPAGPLAVDQTDVPPAAVC